MVKMMDFSEEFIKRYKVKRTETQNYHYMANHINNILHEFLCLNFDSVQNKLIKYLSEEDIDERDLTFIINLATVSGKKEKFVNKAFDIALDKTKFSYSVEYKALLIQHFSKREKLAFQKYLNKALDSSNPLHISAENAKYIAKRIVSSKMELTKEQATYLLSLLKKIKIKHEGQYIVYLGLLNYLAKFNPNAYVVFENKFNDLYDQPNYALTAPATVVKVLNTCSDPSLRLKLAKTFLRPPFKNDPYIKKALSKKIPEISKLLNLE